MLKFEVDLWGEKIRLESEDKDLMLEVTDYLNKRMQEVCEDGTVLTTKIASLRTAFTIAAEYIVLEKKIKKLNYTINSIDEQIDGFLCSIK